MSQEQPGPLRTSVGPGQAGSLPEIGGIAAGTVTGITHFGAFVTLDGGQSGLIHISELANQFVRDVRDHVNLNDRVEVRVLQINPTNGKYDLSLKQAQSPAAPAAAPQPWRRPRREKMLPDGADPAFEEKLAKFMKASSERLIDVRRNLEAKRGGRLK